MALITSYTPLNYQFIINLLTTCTAILFVISIKVKSCRNSSVENRTPIEVNSSNTVDYQLSTQTASPEHHRSPSPSAPPPYRGPAPPPPYSDYYKY